MGTYHHGDLRAALIASGLDILERDGLDALSLRSVAREVGVSHAAPARHFADATEFLAAIAAVGFRQLEARLLAAQRGPWDRRLLATGRAYVDFALERPELYRVLFHPSLAHLPEGAQELREASMSAFAALCSIVESAIERGLVVDRPVRDLALTMWSTVHGVCGLINDRQLAERDFDDEARALADTVIANLFLGLAPH